MFQHRTAEEMFILLSALAGAIHMVAPDHWIPASLVGWQRSWKLSTLLGASSLALTLHLLAGFVIYLAMTPLLEGINPDRFFLFAVGWVFTIALVRALRYSRIGDVLRTGSNRLQGDWMVLLLLGPCESIIPIFLKAKHLGVGYATPFLAFFLGTLVMGEALIILARSRWNSPLSLSRSIRWANRRRSIVPVVAGVAIGLIFLLRLH